MLFADLALARRLEMTDALAGVEFARAWAARHSHEGEVSVSVAGGHASFAGVGSPLTQAFALGMNGPVSEADMERMEEFYESNASAVNIETCPLADTSLLELLNDRSYRVIEYSNVFAREITDESLSWRDEADEVSVRTPGLDEVETYTSVVTKSFFETIEITAEFLDMIASPFYAAGAHFFLAEVAGVPAGGAMMSIHGGVASFGGAGTLPEFRNRGAQKALILARLAFAAQSGCDIAMVATMPGSVSHRNVERQGFRVAYTRSKWMRQLTSSLSA